MSKIAQSKTSHQIIHTHISKLYYNQYAYRVMLRFDTKKDCRRATSDLACAMSGKQYRTMCSRVGSRQSTRYNLTAYLLDQQDHDHVINLFASNVCQHSTPYNSQQLVDLKTRPNILYRKSFFYNKYRYRISFKRTRMNGQESASMGLPPPSSYFANLTHLSFYSGGHSYHWYLNSIKDHYTTDEIKWHPNYYKYKQFEHHHNQCLYTSDQGIVMQCSMSIPEYINKIDEVFLVP